MNGFNNLFDILGGRKFGITGAVVATLLAFIGTGVLQGDERGWAMLGCVFLAMIYTLCNVWQKDVLKNGNGEVKQ